MNKGYCKPNDTWNGTDTGKTTSLDDCQRGYL